MVHAVVLGAALTAWGIMVRSESHSDLKIQASGSLEKFQFLISWKLQPLFINSNTVIFDLTYISYSKLGTGN